MRTKNTPMWIDFDLVSKQGYFDISVKQANGLSVLDVISNVILGAFPTRSQQRAITSACGPTIPKPKDNAIIIKVPLEIKEPINVEEKKQDGQGDKIQQQQQTPLISKPRNWASGDIFFEDDDDVKMTDMITTTTSHNDGVGKPKNENVIPVEEDDGLPSFKSSYAIIWPDTNSKRSQQIIILKQIIAKLTHTFGPTIGGVPITKIIDIEVLASDRKGKRFLFHDKHEYMGEGNLVRHKRPSMPWDWYDGSPPSHQISDTTKSARGLCPLPFKTFVLATSLRRSMTAPLAPCITRSMDCLVDTNSEHLQQDIIVSSYMPLALHTQGTSISEGNLSGFIGTGSSSSLSSYYRSSFGPPAPIIKIKLDKACRIGERIRELLIPYLGDGIKFHSLSREWFNSKYLQYSGDFDAKSARCVFKSTRTEIYIHKSNRSSFRITERKIYLSDFDCCGRAAGPNRKKPVEVFWNDDKIRSHKGIRACRP